MINQIKIQEVKETAFLDVIIDNNLKWSAHIMYISKKIAKGIGILLKFRKGFDNDTLLSLYHTFVYPYLHYCIHIWGKAYKTHLNDLVDSVVICKDVIYQGTGISCNSRRSIYHSEIRIGIHNI